MILKTLKQHSGASSYRFSDWFDAFDALEEYLDSLPADHKKIVFIDEMPWMDTGRSNFVIALENFWNGWAMHRDDIMLIATGSATSWMRDKLVSNQGGLHARITCQLHIVPFSLCETEEYLRCRGISWANDRYQILQSYMILGGVPYYYSTLLPKLSLAQNIDLLCFKADGKLRIEFDELYNALFQNAGLYIEIVRILAENKFKFIEPNNTRDEHWWSNNLDSPPLSAWFGLSFELVCLLHQQQIKAALGLSKISTAISTWRCPPSEKEQTRGAQIDMIIERADRIIHLCEMKFSLSVFHITQDYERKLRERIGLFQYHTGTKKSLVNTFVTTYGVADGIHKSIVHSEVTMDDLFNS